MKIHRSIHRLQIQPEPSTTKSGSGIQKKQTKNAYVESKTVCLQVLDPSAEDHSGSDATDGKKDGEQKDPAALDKEIRLQIIHQVIPQKIRGTKKDADPDGENSGSEDSGNAADDGKDSGNEAGENTGNEEDNTGESGGENIGDEDPAAEDTDKKDTDIAENDSENHLPKRQEDIPESETYETEGYWNVSLSEIFQDPDGDDLTYYEKGERDEDWTPVDGDSYLCHLEEKSGDLSFYCKGSGRLRRCLCRNSEKERRGGTGSIRSTEGSGEIRGKGYGRGTFLIRRRRGSFCFQYGKF